MRQRGQPHGTIVMVGTVAAVLATNNLALGVGLGVVLSCIFFARKIAKATTVTSSLDGTRRTYEVSGQLFFVSSESFLASFDTAEELDHVTLDFTRAHVWDATAVEAIEKLAQRFEAAGTEVSIHGINDEGRALMQRLGAFDTARPAAAGD